MNPAKIKTGRQEGTTPVSDSVTDTLQGIIYHSEGPSRFVRESEHKTRMSKLAMPCPHIMNNFFRFSCPPVHKPEVRIRRQHR